jgi:hypothetical protein
MKIDSIDHLVLTVRNIERTCDFHSCVLGMEIVTFGAGRKALSFGSQKFNLHEAGKEFEPKVERPTPGAIDLCLLTSVPIAEVVAHLAASTSSKVPWRARVRKVPSCRCTSVIPT